MFEIGNSYTRAEISKELGGSTVTYLPNVNGKVVCACLKEDMDGRAPDFIYVGEKPKVVQYAQMLKKQTEPIPIFVAKYSGEWIYRGRYAVKKALTDPKELKEHTDIAGRTLTMVFYMQEAPCLK